LPPPWPPQGTAKRYQAQPYERGRDPDGHAERNRGSSERIEQRGEREAEQQEHRQAKGERAPRHL
jgi:hypothetical protein